ncbi:MAG: hypothetical protein M9962_14320 [Oligoflexia bacterium]|nr:hypothetical protein [Oligoflexia bacterium]
MNSLSKHIFIFGLALTNLQAFASSLEFGETTKYINKINEARLQICSALDEKKQAENFRNFGCRDQKFLEKSQKDLPLEEAKLFHFIQDEVIAVDYKSISDLLKIKYDDIFDYVRANVELNGAEEVIDAEHRHLNNYRTFIEALKNGKYSNEDMLFVDGASALLQLANSIVINSIEKNLSNQQIAKYSYGFAERFYDRCKRLSSNPRYCLPKKHLRSSTGLAISAVRDLR